MLSALSGTTTMELRYTTMRSLRESTIARLCIYVVHGENVDGLIVSYAEVYGISWRNFAGRMVRRLSRLQGVESNEHAMIFIARMHSAGVNMPRMSLPSDKNKQ